MLPATPGCLVLVTSRNQLTGLAAAEDAMPLALDLLTGEEAEELLAARLGGDRPAADPAAAQELTGLCARCRSRWPSPPPALPPSPRCPWPTWPPSCATRVAGWTPGDPAASVRAVFSWSYQQLDPAAARMLRLLGLHHGPAIGAPAAASLAGLPLRQPAPS